MAAKKLEWSARSVSNLAAIKGYISDDNPIAAELVIRSILSTADNLPEFPMLGPIGQRSGIRELVLAKYPYTIIYRLTVNKVFVVAVLHESRKHRSLSNIRSNIKPNLFSHITCAR
jgi:plasmid stabilization system protein ParE